MIGAGLSGLVFAHTMRGSAEVRLFEKSHSYGGRMSTRRQNGFQFDHGAQFFSAKTKAFQHFLDPWLKAGVIARWNARFVEFEANQVTDRRTWSDQPPHYIGVPGMNALGRALAEPLDVATDTRVVEITGQPGSWQLRDGDGEELGEFDWVVSSIPAAQAMTLLPPAFTHRQTLGQCQMPGCFSLMLGFDAPLPLDWDAALVKQAAISWISVDSSKPGRNGSTLLVQASNQWAEEHIELDRRIVTEQLVRETSRIIGLDLGHARHVALHRWRYANPAPQQGPHSLVDPDSYLASCGDWCIRGRVESAYLSGLDAAQRILKTARLQSKKKKS